MPSVHFVTCEIAFVPSLEAKNIRKFPLKSISEILQFLLTKCSPESTSSNDNKLCPSRKSSKRSSTRLETYKWRHYISK